MRRLAPTRAERNRHGHHPAGSPRLSLWITPGEDLGRSHQALPHPARFTLAYTPGVAEPCLAIEKNPRRVQVHHPRQPGGSDHQRHRRAGPGRHRGARRQAGHGGQGRPLQALCRHRRIRPGSGQQNPEEIIRLCQLLEPTFGGINLEDIKARSALHRGTLRRKMQIPVFHDDQHGTAIISGAALLNALELVGQGHQQVKGGLQRGGRRRPSPAPRIYVLLGVRRENIIMWTRQGVVYQDERQDMNPYKARFAQATDARTLAERSGLPMCLSGCRQGAPSRRHMIAPWPPRPIIFALANPDPEIAYDEAQGRPPRRHHGHRALRLSQPGEQRALASPSSSAARSTCARRHQRRDEDGATRALAELAPRTCPTRLPSLRRRSALSFGPDYIIPKPFDARVLVWVAPAVARAAMETGVAHEPWTSTAIPRKAGVAAG